MSRDISFQTAFSKSGKFFLLAVSLLPFFAFAQPALAQQGELTLKLVPNRSGTIIEVEVGKSNPLFLEVKNVSKNIITDIKLSSDKGGGWSIDFEPGIIPSLNPESLQTINVNIRPPADVVRGEHPINIIAEAKETRKVQNFTVIVKVAALNLMLLSPNRVPFPNEVRAGQDNAFLLEVNNISNTVVTGIEFSSDRTEGWVIGFNPDRIDSLPPGNLRTVDVTIRPPGKATIEATQITLIAEANETRQIHQLFFTVKPAQIWIWVWLVAGVALVAVFVFIYRRFGRE
ncbi:MAG: hypothetical protein HYX80_03415 [Chloroflexi bacterium]|nr:hypothetical protein [Chloroflexota bacterium]